MGDARAPDQERDPVVGEHRLARVVEQAGCEAVVGGEDDDEVVAQPGVLADGLQEPAELGVGALHGGEVLRRHPAVLVAEPVGQRDVQEREGPMGADEVGARVLHQLGLVLVDLVAVDAGPPRALVEAELLLGREECGRPAGVVRDGEDRRHRVSRCLLHGHRRPVVVPGHAVSTLGRVDPAAGHHAGVVGQGDRLLVLRARVEGACPFVEQPVEGRRAVGAELLDRVGVEPVDRDRQHTGRGRRLRSGGPDAWSVPAARRAGCTRSRRAGPGRERGRGPARRRGGTCARRYRA